MAAQLLEAAATRKLAPAAATTDACQATTLTLIFLCAGDAQDGLKTYAHRKVLFTVGLLPSHHTCYCALSTQIAVLFAGCAESVRLCAASLPTYNSRLLLLAGCG